MVDTEGLHRCKVEPQLFYSDIGELFAAHVDDIIFCTPKPEPVYVMFEEVFRLKRGHIMSETWMKIVYKEKIVVTYNIDKGGDDITVSVRLVNRKAGNSMKHTMPIASVGGPVSECYENKKVTIFNDNYPTGRILQEWENDSHFVLNVISSRRQC